jgi:zinc transport system permease protein
MLVLIAVIFLIITLFYRQFLLLSFEPEFARTQGVPVPLLHFVQLAMVAVSVVMIIQVVGLILVIALLSIPPYLAGQQARSLFSMMLMASLWSMVFCTAGLLLSYQFDLTTGATIIAVATVTFFIVLSIRALWSK